MAFPASSVSVPSLVTWQASYLGLTMGPSTGINFKKLEGFDLGQGMIRTGDAGRPRDHGEFIGLDLLGGREITATVDVSATPGGASFNTNWAAFATATLPQGATEQPFFVNLPGYGTLACMARPRRRSIPLDITVALGSLAQNCMVEWHAVDPRMYSTPTATATCGFPAVSGGLTFNFTFNFSFGGAATNNLMTVNNAGNIDCRPVITITGPCTNPVLTLTSFAGVPYMGFTVSLNTGDQLVIDMDAHSALLYSAGTNLGANRVSAMTFGSTWWSLQPGSNTVAATSSDTGAVAGTVSMQWASAYVI